MPDLALPKDVETRLIGIYGERHRRYLKEYHKVQYINLLTFGKLHSYLADINDQAQEPFEFLVTEMAKKEGMTETLKAENQIERVRRMNNIRNRAQEIANHEIIYR